MKGMLPKPICKQLVNILDYYTILLDPHVDLKIV